jgi:hypothetical protein
MKILSIIVALFGSAAQKVSQLWAREIGQWGETAQNGNKLFVVLLKMLYFYTDRE